MNSYYIKIQKNLDVLEGYLFFITDFKDLKFIEPHELVLKDKVDVISHDINMTGFVENPLLCVSDEYDLKFNGSYKNRFSYFDDSKLVCVSYSRSNVNFKLNSPLLLADGHHRLAALKERSIFASARKIPIFLISNTNIKIEPFIHFQKENFIPDLTCLDKKLFSSDRYKELNDNEYAVNLYFDNKVSTFYLSDISFLNELKNVFFRKGKPIEYLNYTEFNSQVSVGGLDVKDSLYIQLPQLSIADLYSFIGSGGILPEHCTYFYPKVPYGFLKNLLENEDHKVTELEKIG